MYDCSRCGGIACDGNQPEYTPKDCPMRNLALSEETKAEYFKGENQKLFVEAAKIEAEGYGQWNRVRETIEMAKRMGYEDIGVAFCIGLIEEVKIFKRLCEERGIRVHTVMCKSGGTDKEYFGIPKEAKMEPDFEAACNPIGQAAYLAEEKVPFVVVMGLCVGHDSLFYKYISRYSDAYCTTLVVKDRALGHNPCAALYGADGYFRNKFGDKE